MKKLWLGIIGAATIVTQQNLTAYSMENLRTLEKASGVAKTAQVAIHALAPETTPGLELIGEVAGEINLLTAYALMDETSILRFTRVLERVAAKQSWQQAPQLDKAFMQEFAKEFFVEFSHGATLEIVSMLRGMALDYLLGTATATTKDRVVRRSAEVAATTLTKPLIDTAFLYFNYLVNKKEGMQAPELSPYLSKALLQTFYTELAYQVAGEVIRTFADGPQRLGTVIPAPARQRGHIATLATLN